VVSHLRGAHPHFTVYRKREMPPRFHYDSGARITPVTAVADEGWNITSRARAAGAKPWATRGEHGFDNLAPSMQALFVAAGPSFKSGVTVPMVRNIDVYPMLAHILGLKPARTDGSLDSVRALLRR
jgi:predicted AlkP superfamily pyrophosphatase or phosphodiesterase